MAKSKKSIQNNNSAMSGLLDIIAPQALEFNTRHIQFGDQLARVMVITDYPTSAGAAWLSRVATMEGVICTTHIHPTDPLELVQGINKSIGELWGILNNGGNALLIQRAEQQYKDATRLLKKIDQEQQNVFYFTTTLLIVAEDLEKLSRRSRKVESALAAAGMRGRSVLFKQEDGLKAVAPWGILPDSIKDIGARNMPAETVAAAFPFVNSGINDGKGIVLGRDKKGGIILLDIWRRGGDRTNSNITVLGKPGMGKSTVIKKIILNEYAQGRKIIAIDPEREYKDMAKNVEGSWVDCGGGLKGRINPLQIRIVPLDDDEQEEGEIPLFTKELATRGALALHIQTLRTFFKLYLKGLSDIEFAILEEELEDLYINDFHITWSTDPATIKNEDYPHIGHLYEKINKKKEEGEEYKRIALLLRRAAIGADSSLWAGCTTVNADSDFIVLDIHSLQESDDVVKRAQYFNILSWAWNEISKNRLEKVLMPVDECYLLADPETPQALQFLRNVSKRIRKYEGGLMPISQNVVDFLDPAVRRHGQALLDNPCFKIIMGQGEKDLEALAKLMNLSEAEIEMLAQGKRGEALLVAGTKRVHARIELADHELEIFGKAGGN